MIAIDGPPNRGILKRPMARKHPKHGHNDDLDREEEAAPPPVTCWLCRRPIGKTIIWDHAVPKSRGDRDVMSKHSICQQMLITHFTNSELQRYWMDVGACRPIPKCANSSIGWRTTFPISRQPLPGRSAEDTRQ